MIGFVIVSHSARIAEGVCELAGQVAQDKVRLAAAGGTGDERNPIGTDATKILDAIASVYSADGVLIFADLGSAVLSAETALDLLDPEKRPHVHLRDSPLVEGTVTAVSQAAAGATIEEIIGGKQAPLPEGPSAEKGITLPNRLGLHARPAAKFIRILRQFDAGVTVENVTKASGPADGGSINALLGLHARQGDRLRLVARGSNASDALAALAAFLESGCGDRIDEVEAPTAAIPISGQLAGIPASAGIAIAPLARLHIASPAIDAARVHDPAIEWQHLLAALHGAREETRALFEWTKTHVGVEEAGIFDAQSLLLDDPDLIDGAKRLIAEEGFNAGFAWQKVAAALNARPDDIRDLTRRVLHRLDEGSAASTPLPRPSIIAAHDLTPSEVKELDLNTAAGVCLETGSTNAHGVIMARARGIPAVVGLGAGLATLPEGTVLALDGERGAVWVSPGDEVLRELGRRREAWLAERREAQALRDRPASTRDGRRVRVFANISSVADAAVAVERGAQGAGVLRTEFLFLGRASAPGEDEQLAAYRAISDALGGRPLVIRTLDIGGDKRLPYVEIGPEANPFLGWRGIRVTLGLRDLFKTQLRAILRAAAGRAIEILFPMISTRSELVEAKAVLREAEAELEREQIGFQKNVKAGVMIEVPSAVAIADQLAREADFFSIGTNDLVQYAMAADRTNARVTAIATPFQPAVLRMISQVAGAARDARIGVAVCGEMAADPRAVPLLIGLGVGELSLSAPLIPEIKRTIARWSVTESEALARQALALDSADAVLKLF